MFCFAKKPRKITDFSDLPDSPGIEISIKEWKALCKKKHPYHGAAMKADVVRFVPGEIDGMEVGELPKGVILVLDSETIAEFGRILHTYREHPFSGFLVENRFDPETGDFTGEPD